MTYQTNDYTPTILGFEDLEVTATVNYTQDTGTIPHDAGDHTSTDTMIDSIIIDNVMWNGYEMPDEFLTMQTREVGYHPASKTVEELIKAHVYDEFQVE